MTSTLIADRADRTSQTAIDLLLSRRSHWPLSAPAPTQQQLQHIFDAAMRAPDHGRLRPWRLITIRDEARHAFGDVLVDLAAARAPDEARSAHEHRRQRAMAAPLIIALVAAVDRSSAVPELEQLLCVGAAAMNMLNVPFICTATAASGRRESIPMSRPCIARLDSTRPNVCLAFCSSGRRRRRRKDN